MVRARRRAALTLRARPHGRAAVAIGASLAVVLTAAYGPRRSAASPPPAPPTVVYVTPAAPASASPTITPTHKATPTHTASPSKSHK